MCMVLLADVGGAVGADADDREVREVAREPGRAQHSGADLVEAAAVDGDVQAAALARGVAVARAARERVEAGAMPDVDVAHQPDALERVEVAVDAGHVELAAELLGAERMRG